jgi:hypothetical protein
MTEQERIQKEPFSEEIREYVRVQRGLDRVQRGLARVQRGLVRVQRGLARVQHGLVGSALACCEAGPSSDLSARHPMEVPPTEPTAVKIWRWASANVYE